MPGYSLNWIFFFFISLNTNWIDMNKNFTWQVSLCQTKKLQKWKWRRKKFWNEQLNEKLHTREKFPFTEFYFNSSSLSSSQSSYLSLEFSHSWFGNFFCSNSSCFLLIFYTYTQIFTAYDDDAKNIPFFILFFFLFHAAFYGPFIWIGWVSLSLFLYQSHHLSLTHHFFRKIKKIIKNRIFCSFQNCFMIVSSRYRNKIEFFLPLSFNLLHYSNVCVKIMKLIDMDYNIVSHKINSTMIECNWVFLV